MGQIPSTVEALVLPILSFVQSRSGLETRRPFSLLVIGFLVGLIFRSTLGYRRMLKWKAEKRELLADLSRTTVENNRLTEMKEVRQVFDSMRSPQRNKKRRELQSRLKKKIKKLK
eukprot:g1483.t1